MRQMVGGGENERGLFRLLLTLNWCPLATTVTLVVTTVSSNSSVATTVSSKALMVTTISSKALLATIVTGKALAKGK